MLTVMASYEMALFRDWSNQYFTVFNLENTLAMTIILFFKMFKI